jgi:hypothetical protein
MRITMTSATEFAIHQRAGKTYTSKGSDPKRAG